MMGGLPCSLERGWSFRGFVCDFSALLGVVFFPLPVELVSGLLGGRFTVVLYIVLCDLALSHKWLVCHIISVT